MDQSQFVSLAGHNSDFAYSIDGSIVFLRVTLEQEDKPCVIVPLQYLTSQRLLDILYSSVPEAQKRFEKECHFRHAAAKCRIGIFDRHSD